MEKNLGQNDDDDTKKVANVDEKVAAMDDKNPLGKPHQIYLKKDHDDNDQSNNFDHYFSKKKKKRKVDEGDEVIIIDGYDEKKMMKEKEVIKFTNFISQMTRIVGPCT